MIGVRLSYKLDNYIRMEEYASLHFQYTGSKLSGHASRQLTSFDVYETKKIRDEMASGFEKWIN